MWNRKDLKEKGKTAFKANRMMCIITAFILAMACGGFPTYNFNFSSEKYPQIEELQNATPDEFVSLLSPQLVLFIVGIIAVASLFSMLLGAFILNPLLVGARKFFIQNAESPVGLDGTNIGYSFENNYMNIVGAMIVTQLYVLLWSLLFIIPGVVKSYEWRLVPYMLSENPQMTGKQARELSSRWMNGNKMDVFILDLSFVGWMFLGLLTLGIVNLVWTNPYKAATGAELYLALKEKNDLYIAY